MNEPLERYYQILFGVAAIQVAMTVLGFWVIYMFYARLRDIADELRKLRVTYEMEQERTIRLAARSTSAPAGNQPVAGDSPYMPKG